MARQAVSIRVTDEFGKPARLDDIRWYMNLNQFVSILKKHTPVGTHEHDQVEQEYRAATTRDGRPLPRLSGDEHSLKRSWKLGTPGIKSIKSKGKPVGIQITSNLPHSRIQDEGGLVRGYSGGWMHWNQGGHDVRTRMRRGFLIQGHNYVEKAVDEFFGGYGWNVGWN